MKQIKNIKVDSIIHKELKRIQSKMKFKRLGSVICWLLNSRKDEI